MRRREFITALGGAAAAWPFVARAQQPILPVIGFLGSGSPDLSGERVRAFRQGLEQIGFFEGQNVAVEYRWAGAENNQLNALAANLVRHPVGIIMAAGEPSALASKSVTTTIPIVFIGGSDPVTLGLVASLNRPGGNITGVTVLNVELAPKRIQVLNKLLPSAPTFAALLDPGAPGFESQSNDLPEAARAHGLKIDFVYANTASEIETAFENLSQRRPIGLVIGASPFFNSRSKQLAALAVRHSLPTVFQTREFAAAGGLISYGGSLTEAYRVGGVYTGRILKGEKPANLPVQQVTKIELIINLKTANALGLTIPLPLLGRADEVIE
jgi:putative ABC transport system substrate-binding protein